jgi:hypothetical protein
MKTGDSESWLFGLPTRRSALEFVIFIPNAACSVFLTLLASFGERLPIWFQQLSLLPATKLAFSASCHEN